MKKKKGIRKSITKEIKDYLYQRAMHCCEMCGIPLSGFKAHIHHRNGRRNDNSLGNLKLICPNCHSKVHSKGGDRLPGGMPGPGPIIFDPPPIGKPKFPRIKI